jgi:hypothetical protein
VKPDDPTETPNAAADASRRRPYAPPAVSWEEAVEVEANLTSACDKIGGMGGLCNTNPSS